MLKLIVGVKGTGKTKEIISLANTAANESKGCVVFLEQGNKLRFDVTHKVRLVDTCEFDITVSLPAFMQAIMILPIFSSTLR